MRLTEKPPANALAMTLLSNSARRKSESSSSLLKEAWNEVSKPIYSVACGGPPRSRAPCSGANHGGDPGAGQGQHRGGSPRSERRGEEPGSTGSQDRRHGTGWILSDFLAPARRVHGHVLHRGVRPCTEKRGRTAR